MDILFLNYGIINWVVLEFRIYIDNINFYWLNIAKPVIFIIYLIFFLNESLITILSSQ